MEHTMAIAHSHSAPHHHTATRTPRQQLMQLSYESLFESDPHTAFIVEHFGILCDHQRTNHRR